MGQCSAPVIRDRGGCQPCCQQVLKGTRQLQHLPAATAAAVAVVRPSRRRVLNEGLAGAATARSKLFTASHTKPVHLDLRRMACLLVACFGQRSPVSGGGLIISRSDHHGHTDGVGEVIEREAGCATGLGPVAHDGGRSFCATATSAGLDGADL